MNMQEELTKIKQMFDATFATWEIRLAPEALRADARGRIEQAGWTIEFLVSADDKGTYLDYYATHRMTNDRHQRIYADGSVVDLPALAEICLRGEEEAFKKRNQQVGEMLKAKGFGE